MQEDEGLIYSRRGSRKTEIQVKKAADIKIK
jgi:hypothetical protein